MPFPPPRFALILCAALAACGPSVTGPVETDLSAALIPANGDTPPGVGGTCWEKAVTPAVIETVTEQVMATPERRGADGKVIAPATFRTETRQRIVTERSAVWFEAPCPKAMDVEFVATLQRALKARGLFTAPLTGTLDAPTRAAIRAWQRPRGLDSDRLALASARALGIVAVPRG